LSRAELLLSAPLLLLWGLSPVVAWWISLPLRTATPALTAAQRKLLHSAARRTWRFFADFVGPRDNWLPPDNVQEYPVQTIASRTSPTNIGMSLLAGLSAYDFGYLTAGELLERTEKTVATLERLERYRGHLYNWYDTQTLKPLHPQYISTVDSGNLLGCLLTLQAGLMELKEQPILATNALQGLQETLRQLAEQAASSPLAPELVKKIQSLQERLSHYASPHTVADTVTMLEALHTASGALLTGLPAAIDTEDELYYWSQAFAQQLQALRDEFNLLIVHPALCHHNPTLLALAGDKSVGRYERASERLTTIDALVERCRELAVMDFEFLYDSASTLLSIGYDVGERRRDPACYDLLASEARLASFLLIAQGALPQKHWFALGRLLTRHGGHVTLISWSGSMFEYLMPQLIMPSYANTLLTASCRTAVVRQIEYGRQRAIPWGISESCYNTADIHQVYQYRAFGVPGLGFKRGLGDDLVIAPYATALALMVMPVEACCNLQRLAESGFLGRYGFFEAIDYTPSRLPRGKRHAIVHTFMAHHQGMSLLAFEHRLLDQPMQRRFMAAPQVRATALLLQERVPKRGATRHPHAAEVSATARPAAVETGSIMRVFSEINIPTPEVHLLSNGSYHVMATHTGGGYSRWRDLAVTRWREDTTVDG
ncbi:MAG: cyclic beta 1-2 glucan synthetase, partial [Halothiobacillaceae bacterium]